MIKEAKQYILDMLEINELISQDIILGDVLEEGRLNVTSFGRKLKQFQEDFEKFVNSKYKTKQDLDKVIKEQNDCLKEIKGYKDLYHEYYKDGKNNDKDKEDDDLTISRLIAYEVIVKQHKAKLKEIAEENGYE